MSTFTTLNKLYKVNNKYIIHHHIHPSYLRKNNDHKITTQKLWMIQISRKCNNKFRRLNILNRWKKWATHPLEKIQWTRSIMICDSPLWFKCHRIYSGIRLPKCWVCCHKTRQKPKSSPTHPLYYKVKILAMLVLSSCDKIKLQPHLMPKHPENKKSP
jgi:hypothetical protein